MAQTRTPYLQNIRQALNTALCLRNFPSQLVERHNVPEVETIGTELYSPELHLPPISIARNENEKTLIEPSINSVRMSVKVKQADEIEQILTRNFMRFLMQRAEDFSILRRKALPGYDISFLITHTHMEEMNKQKLIDFIIEFMQEIDREISEMKIDVNARARTIATEFLKQFT
eukprot:tig00020904_g15258.t1